MCGENPPRTQHEHKKKKTPTASRVHNDMEQLELLLIFSDRRKWHGGSKRRVQENGEQLHVLEVFFKKKAWQRRWPRLSINRRERQTATSMHSAVERYKGLICTTGIFLQNILGFVKQALAKWPSTVGFHFYKVLEQAAQVFVWQKYQVRVARVVMGVDGDW